MVDLQEYIEQTKKQIKAGLGNDAKLAGNALLEISTTTSSESGGGFHISVIELGAGVKAEEVQKLTVPFTLVTEVDNAKEIADIAEHKRRAREQNNIRDSMGG